jgi:hypothetical protein
LSENIELQEDKIDNTDNDDADDKCVTGSGNSLITAPFIIIDMKPTAVKKTNKHSNSEYNKYNHSYTHFFYPFFF